MLASKLAQQSSRRLVLCSRAFSNGYVARHDNPLVPIVFVAIRGKSIDVHWPVGPSPSSRSSPPNAPQRRPRPKTTHTARKKSSCSRKRQGRRWQKYHRRCVFTLMVLLMHLFIRAPYSQSRIFSRDAKASISWTTNTCWCAGLGYIWAVYTDTHGSPTHGRTALDVKCVPNSLFTF